MKKRGFITRLGAGLLAVLFVFTLTACGGSKDVSGNYHTDLKIADFMPESDMASLTELEDQGMGFVSDMTLRFNLDLTEDKNFTLYIDTEDLKTQFTNGISDSAEDIVLKQIEEYGVSEDQYEDLAKAAGYDDYDSMIEGLKNDMIDEVSSYVDSFASEFDSITVSGKYSVTKNKVLFAGTDTDGLALDAADIAEDGSLTLNMEYEGENIPLSFVK